jgi:hypothetical protein
MAMLSHGPLLQTNVLHTCCAPVLWNSTYSVLTFIALLLSSNASPCRVWTWEPAAKPQSSGVTDTCPALMAATSPPGCGCSISKTRSALGPHSYWPLSLLSAAAKGYEHARCSHLRGGHRQHRCQFISTRPVWTCVQAMLYVSRW